MNMRTNVARLHDATNVASVRFESKFGIPVLVDALADLDRDVKLSQALLDAVLRWHDDNHTGPAWLCGPEDGPCRIAGMW